ncbi:nucleotide disphospho-sugar-binding domain-containing protein [Streptomyces sp. V4-01]|uniref:Nucleotide disphospho-sugar-binding domain-containing protein n=1 Tax=Actinacidiphila polyblastidii TaxID=3110430 RepID=A0ABU7PC34_9ACTN|nr:nucleotide disphospho-sugar-binding domain-containing protein [Streptomyces sp. V4-01]
MRILFTSVALPGHFFPLVPLAWTCRTLGHEVLIAVPDHFAATAVRTGLPVASSGAVPDFVDLQAGKAPPRSFEDGLVEHGEVFGRMAAGQLAGVRTLVASWRPDVVVSERAEFAGPLAAAERGVARAEFQWGIPSLDEYRTGAARVLAAEPGGLGAAGLPQPHLVFNAWPPSLRLAHAAGHRGVRHVAYNGDARVPGWAVAPRRRPRVCVTLGTLLPRLGDAARPGALDRVLSDLRRLDVEVVVAVADDVAARWQPLPEQVAHAGMLPLAQVLPACDVLIGHGGHGTTLTALAAGRPQLLLPRFDDQVDNAGAVAKSGAGIRLYPEETGPGVIAEAVGALLDDPRFGGAAESVAAEIAAQPPLADAAQDILALAG